MIEINEVPNPDAVKMAPIREKQDIYIPDVIDLNIPRRNGFIYCLTGSGGSGKSSLMLNMFKSKSNYRGKFDNLFYICPMSSYLSVQNHPFQFHNKVFHELTVPILEGIYNQLNAIKEKQEEIAKKKKLALERKKKGVKINMQFVDEEAKDDDEEDDDRIQYSCIIIDDFANDLKNVDIQNYLSKMLIKARHLCCSFIITLQSFLYLPKILRKQLTNATIFKPKNREEYQSICKELLKMNQENGLLLEKYVFDAPYTHLDIDLIEDKFYKNFNQLIITEKKA